MSRKSVSIKNEIVPLYSLSRFDLFFLHLRSFLLDYKDMAEKIPLGANILDVGCGHGILPNYLALSDPSSTVRGIDLDAARIEKAGKTIGDRRNISFAVGDLMKTDIAGVDVVLLIDLMHYFPYEEQNGIIKRVGDGLQAGGILIFRDPDTKPKWRFYWNYLHEIAMVNSNFTKTHLKSLFFRSSREFKSLLQSIGFHVKIYPNKSPLPYSDTLYVCKKTR